MTLVRRLITAVLVTLLSLPAGYAIAQDASSPEAATGGDTAFASGLGVPATLFDERGNPVMTMAVTNVELDWTDYDDMWAPEAGKMYVVMTIEYTNLTNRPMQIDPYALQVIDGYGMIAEAGYYFSESDFTVEAIAIEPGATGESLTVHGMWDDTAPMLVMYQPMYGQMVVVHIPN